MSFSRILVKALSFIDTCLRGQLEIFHIRTYTRKGCYHFSPSTRECHFSRRYCIKLKRSIEDDQPSNAHQGDREFSAALGSLARGYLRNYLPGSGACTGYTKFDVRGCANGSAETSLRRDDNAGSLRLAPDHISLKDLSRYDTHRALSKCSKRRKPAAKAALSARARESSGNWRKPGRDYSFLGQIQLRATR